ncbi:MAG: hypothetical protein B6D72_06875 [gamma proteobacterium symbiont of Ctena orbiculata]|uniref:GIY-YIG nuclease family protein n=1 Tax=Candidatus Thiodiazotropha taylori TaxID=2792791 RepID=A0A944MAI3_9GAMM|nr:GIY-YIG nuclease family protein [Candidatus Thiodiazotropha taylori]PVV07896.1 MAG: hypothetical protein B6D82_15945 [gamma proteobacterium symbiont of Ctena orbiculata]MBT2990329.1 GIY-YIG nuclease family protein [Candidatus Thiodiazotropha taylori]MBT2997985.1 GIY-YIG nuclease family protein [Candidatus Thiodiazotropha taylori]MBT3002196.1 GIY-YIG nuclease family protein [Candidatus Thiodiazotropha taylori]
MKLFLAKGSPSSLRTGEISNWTGKAISAPRTELYDFLKREETKGPGIYFLSGTDPESGEPALYIGEAETVAARIKNHAEKDFWVNVTAFVSKDENLTKAHIRYLEGTLIDIAGKKSGFVLLNSTSSGAKLPESDAAEMDIFLDKVFQLLPVLGITHFRDLVEKPSTQKEHLYCTIKGLKAKGKRTSNGFLVFKGSKGVPDPRPSATKMKGKRNKLLSAGVLAENGDFIEFIKNYEFTSPSAAASMIRGGASNGLTSWKDAKGKSLKQIEESET